MLIKTASLTPAALRVIRAKGTEAPAADTSTDFANTAGSYLCRQCGTALFRTDTQFHSGCGWPSFDAAIAGAVNELPDPDGRRTEIVCAQCQAHLGHVFSGEGFTDKNSRHCVNTISLDFVADAHVQATEEAIYAAGCFWGVEHLLKQLPGILKTEVGYTGGTLTEPSYKAICTGETGHFEAVRVLFDPIKINYATLTRYFFEIHDPAQSDGQGPDKGSQYLSAIFYHNATQQQIAAQVMAVLRSIGVPIATQLKPAQVFWPAETYHQAYYAKTGGLPYCHTYTKRFD